MTFMDKSMLGGQGYLLSGCARRAGSDQSGSRRPPGDGIMDFRKPVAGAASKLTPRPEVAGYQQTTRTTSGAS